MNHEQAQKKYLMKKLENPLPSLPEDERIYFEVPYMSRGLAKYCHCGFDPDRKLWFTGCHNAMLFALVRAYDVSEETSEKAKDLLRQVLEQD